MALHATLEGVCLHAGCPSRVTLWREHGPVTLEQHDRSHPLHTLRIARSDYGVALTDGDRLHVDLIEHLLAALGGLGIHDGLHVRVDGPELPLLDGGCRRYVDALFSLEVEACRRDGGDSVADAARLHIVRPGEFRARGGAVYRLIPGDSIEIRVEICFEHRAIMRQSAQWNGNVQQFVDCIAPARTFGFSADAAQLAARGRARGAVSGCRDVLESILVFGEHGVAEGSPVPTPNEPARHKLLDLIGDCYLHGGPPLGRLLAIQPGHSATHDVIRQALDRGVIERRNPRAISHRLV